ncbi:VWD domain-containing protein [Brumimicrobium mesophilum]|uniref:VWD domain-containing protein n=1 Tax=Brumimicrobium mesophilum TaxID=392717 RepID=UPI000D13F169|nr:VWD domain-containing protein [Brumimicrobium mesophilum]
MKYFTLLLVQLFALSLWANIQSDPVPFERQDSDHIKEILKAWNTEKGEYLYESMAAIVMHEKQPERPFGVNQTSYELLQTMDDNRIDRMERIAATELQNERNTHSGERYYWKEWSDYLQSSRCEMNRDGKSSGDPHMRTFDGESFDFQNAGDYLLTASEDNSFMIQTQQMRTSSSVALNSAVAMNINGDLLTFTSVSKDSEEKMIHINGEEIQTEKTDLALPQGGVVNYSKGKYLVKWPTGEQLSISERSFKDSKLFDLNVYVPQCNSNYYGLLGNNDGDRKNDLVVYDRETDSELTRESGEMNREDVFGSNRRNPVVLERVSKELFFITRTYGGEFQLDESTSLLREQMVNIPDSIRYPKELLTLAQLEDEQIEEGLRKAREAGVAEEDMFEAVYDYGHLGLEPIAMTDDYVAPKEANRSKEPILNKDGDGLKENEEKSTNSQIRVRPSIFIGTGVRVSPPRRNYPRTQPSPSTPRRTGGTSPRIPTSPRSGGR